MSREKSLIKNITIIGFGTFFPKLTAIITLPIVTGYLTKNEYGTYDLILTLISLILPLATLQIQSSAFRFLIQIRDKYSECRIIISNIISFTLLMSIIPLCVICFFLGSYDLITRLIIIFYFFCDIVLHTFQQIIRGLGKNVYYSISTVINSLINLVLVVIFVKVFQLGLVGVIASLVVANIIAIITLIIGCGIYGYVDFSLFSKKTIVSLISYSWPLIPNNLSSWVMTLSDRLLLSLFLGVKVNAVYAVAQKIPNLLLIVQSTFSLAWQENASLSSSDADIDHYYSSTFDSVFNIVIGGCAILIGTSPLLFKLLIRGDYAEAYLQMPILFLAVIFITLSSYLAGIYIADKRTKEIGVTTTIAAFINLIVDLVCIRFIGIWAASFSTLVSYIFLFLYRIIDLKKYHNVKYNESKMIIFITVIVLMCFGVNVQNFYINILNIIVAIIVAWILNKKLINALISKIKR